MYFENPLQILPTLPLSSGGPLSPLEIYTTVSSLYTSPLAQYLPPMSELITTALKVNSMATSVQDANERINTVLKDTVNKLASNLGVKLPATSASSNTSPSTTLQNLANLLSPKTTTTAKPSLLETFGNWLMGTTAAKPAVISNPLTGIIG